MKLSKKALTAMIAVSIAATTVSAASIVQKMAQTALEQEVSVPVSQEAITLQTDTVLQQPEETGGAETSTAVQNIEKEESSDKDGYSKEESLEVSKSLGETAAAANGEETVAAENIAAENVTEEPAEELAEETAEELAEDEFFLASGSTSTDLKDTDVTFEYEEYSCNMSDGTVKEGYAITDINGSGDITIPAEIDGKPVLAIKGSEFGKPVGGIENVDSIDFS